MGVRKKVLLLASVALAMLLASWGGIRAEMAQADSRPNIIFVMSDDQNAATLEKMPYVGGGYSKFLELGFDQSQVARWLDLSGYQTGMFGLYVNGYDSRVHPQPLGWDKVSAYTFDYNNKILPLTTFRDGAVKDNALRWLSESVDGGPMFMWICFHGPHDPYDTYDPVFENRFVDETVPRPLSFNEEDVSNKPPYVQERLRFTDQEVASLDEAHRDRLRQLPTVNANTVKLFEKGSSVPLAAQVSYEAATKRAILNPYTDLVVGKSYRAVVTIGVRDQAGNRLDQDPTATGNQRKMWFFTVRH